MSSPFKKNLETLHNLVVKDLLSRIESGTATSADLNVARQLLKDNGIDCAALEGTPIQRLALTLPFEGVEKEAC